MRGEDGDMYTVTKDELSSKNESGPKADGCIFCGKKLPEGASFCPRCGKKQGAADSNTCPACGSALKGEMNYCVRCGAKASS